MIRHFDVMRQIEVAAADAFGSHLAGVHKGAFPRRFQVGELAPFVVDGDFVVVEMKEIPRHDPATAAATAGS